MTTSATWETQQCVGLAKRKSFRNVHNEHFGQPKSRADVVEHGEVKLSRQCYITGAPASCQAKKLNFITEAMENRWRGHENSTPELSTFCLNDGSEVEMTEGKKISDK